MYVNHLFFCEVRICYHLIKFYERASFAAPPSIVDWFLNLAIINSWGMKSWIWLWCYSISRGWGNYFLIVKLQRDLFSLSFFFWIVAWTINISINVFIHVFKTWLIGLVQYLLGHVEEVTLLIIINITWSIRIQNINIIILCFIVLLKFIRYHKAGSIIAFLFVSLRLLYVSNNLFTYWRKELLHLLLIKTFRFVICRV